MADTDPSSYILRYNTLTGGPEFFVGSDWYPFASSGGASDPLTLGVITIDGTTFGSITGATVIASGNDDFAITAHTGKTIELQAGDDNTKGITVAANGTVSVNNTLRLSTNGELSVGDPGVSGVTPVSYMDNGLIEIIDQTTSTSNWVHLGLDSIFIATAGNPAVSAEAALEVSSTTKGFLPPRMTSTQREALALKEGLTVYDTTLHAMCVYNGTSWFTVDMTVIA